MTAGSDFASQRQIVEALPGVFSAGESSGGAAAPAPVVRGTSPGGVWVELRGPVVSVGTTEPQDIQALLDALRGRGLVIRRVQQVRPSLEDLFMEAVDAGNAIGFAPGRGRGPRDHADVGDAS